MSCAPKGYQREYTMSCTPLKIQGFDQSLTSPKCGSEEIWANALKLWTLAQSDGTFF